jgi:hypothetical protein
MELMKMGTSMPPPRQAKIIEISLYDIEAAGEILSKTRHPSRKENV